jgi:hypothetical protein
MRLGADTNLETLLHKLESAYGISFQDDLLMREFYDAQQKTDEDVTTWANRIEDLLHKACQKPNIRAPLRLQFMLGDRHRKRYSLEQHG